MDCFLRLKRHLVQRDSRMIVTTRPSIFRILAATAHSKNGDECYPVTSANSTRGGFGFLLFLLLSGRGAILSSLHGSLARFLVFMKDPSPKAHNNRA